MAAARLEDPAAPGMLYTPVEGRRRVAVEIVTGNGSGPALTVSPLFAYLVGTAGYVYPGPLFGRDGQIEPVTLQPGDEMQGWAAFELPDGAMPEAVRYTVDQVQQPSAAHGPHRPVGAAAGP